MILLQAALQFYQHCLLKMFFFSVCVVGLFFKNQMALEKCGFICGFSGLFRWQYHAIFIDVTIYKNLKFGVGGVASSNFYFIVQDHFGYPDLFIFPVKFKSFFQFM